MQDITLSTESIKHISQALSFSLEKKLNQLIPAPIEKYVSRKEAAQILGVKPDTVSGYAVTGLIAYKRLGKQYLFSLRDIESFNMPNRETKLSQSH